MFHELLSMYATLESICALDASLRRFLPCFCGMETSFALGESGTMRGSLALCLCCFVSSDSLVNTRMVSQHNQTLFTSAVMVVMPWLICVRTSPRNKTLTSKAIYNKVSPGPSLAAIMPHPGRSSWQVYPHLEVKDKSAGGVNTKVRKAQSDLSWNDSSLIMRDLTLGVSCLGSRPLRHNGNDSVFRHLHGSLLPAFGRL